MANGSLSGGFETIFEWWAEILRYVGGDFAAQNAFIVTMLLAAVFGITATLLYTALGRIEQFSGSESMKKYLSILKEQYFYGA